MQLGDLHVDWQTRCVMRQSKDLALSDLNFEVFRIIVDAFPDVVGSDELKAAWQGVHVSEETIAKRITLLRQALGDSGRSPKYIETIRGRGYRLKIAPKGPEESAETSDDKQPRAAAFRTIIIPIATAALAAGVLAVWTTFSSIKNTESIPPQLIEFTIPVDSSAITARLIPSCENRTQGLAEIAGNGGFVLVVEKEGLPQSAGRQLDFQAQQREAEGSPKALAQASLLRSALQDIHFGAYDQNSQGADTVCPVNKPNSQ